MAKIPRNNLLDTEAASAELGCSAAALLKFRSERRGPPYVKVGRLVRYRRRDLVRWVRAQRVLPEQTTRTKGAGHAATA